jgi:xylan 1,4-beta-xylosidase
VYPQNAYRNGALYASYTAAMMKNVFELADRRRTNIQGMLTWAFEFEDQPYFAGFRTLATNGIDKPVLNFFRMAALMQGDRVKTESRGRTPLDRILAEGVRGDPDVDALAVRSDREISVLTWNYHDDDVPAVEAKVRLEIAGIPGTATRVLVRHYRIDESHSNSWTAWKAMGSPQHPTPEQYGSLEAAGQLQLAGSPRFVDVRGGAMQLEFSLPRQGVSLHELSW